MVDTNLVFKIAFPIFLIVVAFIVYGRKKGRFGAYVVSSFSGALFVFAFTAFLQMFVHFDSSGLKQLYIILLTPFEFALGMWIGGKLYGKAF